MKKYNLVVSSILLRRFFRFLYELSRRSEVESWRVKPWKPKDLEGMNFSFSFRATREEVLLSEFCQTFASSKDVKEVMKRTNSGRNYLWKMDVGIFYCFTYESSPDVNFVDVVVSLFCIYEERPVEKSWGIIYQGYCFEFLESFRPFLEKINKKPDKEFIERFLKFFSKRAVCFTVDSFSLNAFPVVISKGETGYRFIHETEKKILNAPTVEAVKEVHRFYSFCQSFVEDVLGVKGLVKKSDLNFPSEKELENLYEEITNSLFESSLLESSLFESSFEKGLV